MRDDLRGKLPVEGDEVFTDFLDRTTHRVERVQKRLAVHDIGLIERYLEGELWVVVQVRLSGLQDTKDYVAIFQREEPIGGIQREGKSIWIESAQAAVIGACAAFGVAAVGT